MPLRLTPRMRDCQVVIQEWIDARGTAPTLEEIAVQLGIKGLGEVSRLLGGLSQGGFIMRAKFRRRSIVILKRIEKDAA